MSNLSLHDFIRKNQEMILVLGILLALLPLSFDTIKDINPKLGGAISIAVSLAVLLIIKNFLFTGEELSVETFIFIGCLTTIAFVTSSLTIQLYTQMTLSFLDMSLSWIYFMIGSISLAKLFAKIQSHIEKTKYILFYINFIILILSLFIVFFNWNFYLEKILLSINIELPIFFTIKHQQLFFQGMIAIIAIYGIFASGIGYFVQELFYGRFLKEKLKNILVWIKNKIINPSTSRL